MTTRFEMENQATQVRIAKALEEIALALKGLGVLQTARSTTKELKEATEIWKEMQK